jgi:type I restriction enzyme, S subunit
MHFPPYPAYKDSGVEWLGEVPNHWELVQLKRRLCFDVGWTPPTGQSEYFEGNLPWANISDLGNHTITKTAKTISPLAVEIAKLPLIPRGSLLFSFKLSIGQVSFAGIDLYSNEAIAAFPPQQGAHLRFMYYMLPLFVVQNANENIYGAKLLNQDLIRSAPIVDIPLAEQRAIAAFLDAETAQIDALVAKHEALITTLQEKRRALISHAVTRGLDPTVPMKDSGVPWLGEVPAHWEITRLKFMADVRTGVAKGRDLGDQKTIEVPYLRVANVQDGYLDLSDITTIPLLYSEMERYLLQVGDVLMNEGGDFDKLGRGYVWQGEIELCAHQNHVFAVRLFNTDDAYWVNLVTQTAYAKQYFISRSKQSTNLASISSSNLQEWYVVMPPKQEREGIVAHVQEATSYINTLIAKAQQFIEVLREHRTALIAAAVTGQIDVRGALIPPAPSPVPGEGERAVRGRGTDAAGSHSIDHTS